MMKTPPTLLDAARWNGKRVGLFGGTFNPPHDGHLHIARIAARYLQLDCVWWMVTPGNPLKDTSALPPVGERLRLCDDIIGNTPAMVATDIESVLGTVKTADTVLALRAAYPQTDFVLITGTDNALTFHEWYRWQDILAHIATVHIARPPARDLVRSCPLKMLANQNHILLNQAGKHDLHPHTSYWITNIPMSSTSSTNLRKSNN